MVHSAVAAIWSTDAVVVNADIEPFIIVDELRVVLAEERLIILIALAISCRIAPPPEHIAAFSVLASAASGRLLGGGAVVDDPDFIPMPATQQDFIALGVVVDAVDMHPIVCPFLPKAASP